jgi:Flp pilus assembly pilin Flp
MKAIKKFMSNEEGLETVEYAVMTALIVGALILAITNLSTDVQGRFDETGAVIDTMASV